MVGSIPPPATNNMSEYKKSFCPLCLAECGILVKTDSNKIISIIPDKSNPVSQGYICERPQRFVDKDDPLLDTPLKRIDGELVPITWEQAVAEIASQLTTYGGDDIFYFDNIQPSDWLESTYMFRFLESLGVSAYTDIFGIEVIDKLTVEYNLLNKTKNTRIESDVANAQTLMLVGKNMWVSNHEVGARSILTDIKRDPNRNLIVVDVVKTRTAEMADYFIQIKPGTDFWFLRSLLKVLIDTDSVDWDWIKNNTVNYDSIGQLADFDLTDYLNICGVEYDQLVELADVIRHSKTLVTKSELGINHTPNSLINYYLLHMLWIIKGSYNCEGGMRAQSLIPTYKKFKCVRQITKHTKQPCAMGGVPAAVVASELPHYKVILVNQSNPINHIPNKSDLVEQFTKAELKIVMDCVLTDTAKLADYVLPTPAYFQKYDIVGGLTTNATNLQLKRPLYSCYKQKTVYEIINLLVKQMSTVPSEFAEWHTAYTTSLYETPIISLLEVLLESSYPANQVKDNIQALLQSGHVTIDTGITTNIKLNLELPDPTILDNPDDTALTVDPEFPFVLAAGYRHSKSTGMNVLNQNNLTIEMHSYDAMQLDILNGEPVCVSTRNGSIIAECELNNNLQHGYIRTPTNKNLNILTGTDIQDRTNPMYKINHARIDKIIK